MNHDKGTSVLLKKKKKKKKLVRGLKSSKESFLENILIWFLPERKMRRYHLHVCTVNMELQPEAS